MEFVRAEDNELVSCVEQKDWNTVVKLCQTNSKLLNSFDEYGRTPLMRTVIDEAENAVLDAMLQYTTKENVKHSDRSGRCILHHLAFYKKTKALKHTLQISSDNVNAQDLSGETPLHICLRSDDDYSKHKETTEILMEYGAIPTIKDRHGMTPVDQYKRNPCKSYAETKRKQLKSQLLNFLRGKTIPVEILARGPAALNAFIEELKEGEIEVNQGILIVMGLGRVGKTSTIKSLLKKEFDPNEPITDAIATNKVYVYDSDDNWNEAAEDKPPVVIIYENEVAESITEKVYKKQKETQQDIKRIQDTNSMQSSLSAQIRQVPESIAARTEEKLRSRSRTRKWKAPSTEFLMEVWDFGGHSVYNTIQQIFIPSFAVVSVVFNLEHDLHEHAIVRDHTTGKLYEHHMTNLEYILHSIRLVYMNCKHFDLDGILCPPVVLIGTHCNSPKLGTTEEKQRSEIKKKCSEIWESLKDKPYEKSVLSKIFTIENSVPFEQSKAADIGEQILNLFKRMVRRVPVKWLLVLQEIGLLRRCHICLKTSEIIDLLKHYGINPEHQGILLQYLHDIGEIRYYPNDRALKDIIVIDLFRVVDLSKAVTTVIDPDLQDPCYRSAWRRLDSGILEEHLLGRLWERLGVADQFFDFFVHLLQRFGLLCEMKITEGKREFIVLSRLRPVPTKFPEMDCGKRAISLFYDFSNYLPDYVFPRVATRFIERFQMTDLIPKLHHEHVELDIDGNHYMILSVAAIKQRRMLKTTIIRRKLISETDEDVEPEPSVCKKILSFFQEELNLLCPSGEEHFKMRMYIPCECCTSNHFHVVRHFNKDILPCGTNAVDVTRYRQIFGDNVEMPLTARVSQLQKTERIKAQEQRFKNFLSELGAHFGNDLNYKYLRLLLYDQLPSELFFQDVNNAVVLFNKLAEHGHISHTDITILSDISELTMLVSAKSCVVEYKSDNQCKEGTGLSLFRKTVFRALREVAQDELGGLVENYISHLGQNEFEDIWDLVFSLEEKELLDDTEKQLEEFANLLNATAKQIMLEILGPPEVRARGEGAVKSYKADISKGCIKVMTSRIIVLGKKGVGKTSSINSMLGKSFNKKEPPTEGIVTTTFIHTDEEDCKWEEKEKYNVFEMHKKNHSTPSKSTKPKTFANPTCDEYTSTESTSSATPADRRQVSSMVGLKSTQHKAFVLGRHFFNEMLQTVTKRTRFMFFRDIQSVSSKDVKSLIEYAGQQVYCGTHRFFVKNGSVYFIEFSLVDKLDDLVELKDPRNGPFNMTNLDMIVFLIRFIYEYAILPYSGKVTWINSDVASPPICLVGTHRDKLRGNEAEKQNEIEAMFQQILNAIRHTPYKKHVDCEQYVLDNTDKLDEGVKKLKRIASSYMKAKATNLPRNWTDFQSKIKEKSETILSMSKDEIKKIGDQCKISDIETVLNYLNDTGIIYYSSTNEKLRNTVIINFPRIIKMVTKINTPFKLKEKRPLYSASWDTFDNKGIIDEKLLLHLYKGDLQQSSINFEDFIELMKNFSMLLEKQDQHGKRVFLVPSQMKITTEPLEVKEDDEQTISIYITANNFLPEATYRGLIVSFLDLMKHKQRRTKNNVYFQNRSDFDLYDDNLVSLGPVNIGNRYALKLEIMRRTIVNESGTEKKEPDSTICMEVLEYLREQLKTVCGTIDGIGYKLCVSCNSCDLSRSNLHELDDCLQEDYIKCSCNYVSTIRFKRLFKDLCVDRPTIQSANQPEETMQDKTQWTQDQVEKFSDLLFELNTLYPNSSSNFRKLKFLLYGILNIGLLSETNAVARTFFNELRTRGRISCTDVNILSDVAEVAMLASAKDCIEKYKKSTKCKAGEKVLTNYRRTLFKVILEIGEFEQLIAQYEEKLKSNSFTDIWDFVFCLETNMLLEDDEIKLMKFAKCLNPRAKGLIENYLKQKQLEKDQLK